MWLYHGQTWRTHTYVHMAKSWTSMRVRETCLNDQFLSSHLVPEYQMFPEIPSKYICSWRSPLIMTSGRYDILWRLDNNHKYLWEYHATFIFHQTKQWKHQNWSQYISCNVLIRPFQCLLSLINIGHVYSITSFIWSMHVIQLGLPLIHCMNWRWSRPHEGFLSQVIRHDISMTKGPSCTFIRCIYQFRCIYHEGQYMWSSDISYF